MKPELQAHLDWYELGEFMSWRYEGELKARYLAEQQRIERAWDNERI